MLPAIRYKLIQGFRERVEVFLVDFCRFLFLFLFDFFGEVWITASESSVSDRLSF